MPKLPPYGKYLDNIQSENLSPTSTIYLFIGQKAFSKANSFQISRPTTICLPPYNCPSLYRWPVQSCDILIFDTGYCEEDYLNDLAYYLYESKAKKVRCVLPDSSLIVFTN